MEALPYLLPQLSDPLPRGAMGTPSLLRVNLERSQIKMMLTSGLTPEPKIKGPEARWVSAEMFVTYLGPGPHRRAASSPQLL